MGCNLITWCLSNNSRWLDKLRVVKIVLGFRGLEGLISYHFIIKREGKSLFECERMQEIISLGECLLNFVWYLFGERGSSISRGQSRGLDKII